MKFNWTLSEKDSVSMNKIVQRIKALRLDVNPHEVEMDIMACHNHAVRLDLEALATASNSNFIHDVMGIHRHIDRATGQLTSCFLPRFADPKGEWTVVEHAGCANEKEVWDGNSYDDANCAMHELYTEPEIAELGVDILKNGSTEY